MHICFVEDTRLHGGTQIWVSEAIRAFMARGHEVTLLTAAGGFNAQDGPETGARVLTYDFDEVIAQDPRHEKIWTEALRPADVAVCTVHPPREGFHCSRFAAKCIQRAGLTTLLEPKTGTIVPEYRRELYAPPEDIRWHVISITDFTRSYLLEDYGIPTDRVSLVYQGTDVARYTRSEDRERRARAAYPVPESASPVLGCIGSFEPRKGQSVLLEALVRVRSELPHVHLLLVGNGPDEDMLRRKVQDMDLASNVTFVPFTRTPEDVFECIDVTVLSSLYKEGLPNVLLESLSMERPVISSRLAGVPEAVVEGRTGLMVEPDDVAQLADAIARLGRDAELRERMGRDGRRLVAENHDKQRQFDRFLDHFATQVPRYRNRSSEPRSKENRTGGYGGNPA